MPKVQMNVWLEDTDRLEIQEKARELGFRTAGEFVVAAARAFEGDARNALADHEQRLRQLEQHAGLG